MGSSKQRIIQWNCRGITPRYEELLLLLTLLRPSVFCLQETYLKPEDTFTFKGFNTYNHIHSDCLRASGGSSIFVHSSCPQREIKLKTDLQAVAVSVTLEKEITLCSIYIPPSFALRPKHLNSLLQQLPSPFMLLGDFNGHNVLWGSKDNDPRGDLIEDFITQNDICLMNDKSNTFLDSGKGTFSALDLSICHPSLYLDYEWSVCEDQHGSDHFPIVIESIKTSEEDHNPKWKLNKANWDLFHTLCDEFLTTSLSDSTDHIADFTSSLIDISEKCIPKTSTNPKKSNPWYNDDCKEAIKQRKDTLSRFCKFPTKDNLNTYRVFRAKARRTIKSSKRKSWRTYVSNLNYKTPIKKVWDMVRKISGKSKSASHQHLNTNFNGGAETKATTKKDIADTLGDAFSTNSANRNYSKEFQNYQKQQEKIKLNFKSSNNEEYNNPFNLDELKDAINKSHDTATGPDEIHYQMLKHLPLKSLQTLLDIF